jgi:hypothetical protein
VNIENIVATLRSEFDRIGHAIGLLENNAPPKARVGRPPGSATKNRGPKRSGGLTPAGRRKLSESMKRRWAQKRGSTKASTSGVAVAKPKKRGVLTAAGRKRLSEAMKKHWAERRQRAS